MQEIACSVGDQWAAVHVWALEPAPCGGPSEVTGSLWAAQGQSRVDHWGGGSALCGPWEGLYSFQEQTSVLPSHKQADLSGATSSRLHY